MKKVFIAILLAALTMGAMAQSNLSKLDELLKKITQQSLVIKKLFDDYKISSKTEPYGTIWSEEFAVGDQVEMFLLSAGMYQQLNNKQKENSKNSLIRISNINALHCELSKINFNAAKRSKNMPTELLNQLDTQSINIQSACEYLKTQKIE
jgi:hypothetical protein